MKNLKNLKGAKMLSKMEQITIKGGLACHPIDYSCPGNEICCHNLCRPDWWMC